MFKAVFWDFGGVFTTSPFEAFDRYERERGLPSNFIRRVNSTNQDTNAWAQLENGRISIEKFDELFIEETRQLGHAVPGTDVLALLDGNIRPRMVEALRTVKSQYQVACLTNNVKDSGNGPGMARDQAKADALAEILGLFDFVLESSATGLRKSEPGFYELALEMAGVDASEVLFLDDLGINLKPARAMGMTTIKVVSEEQALAELADALQLDL